MQNKYDCSQTVDEESVKVIYSRRHEIRQLDLRDMSTVSLVSGLSNAIALDFFWDKKLLIWTDVGLDKIFTGYIVSNSESMLVAFWFSVNFVYTHTFMCA